MIENGLPCVYCAGDALATTIDHFPPITMFEKRLRPKGLEFPACDACNEGARLDELTASFLSRVFPKQTGELETAEYLNALEAMKNNRLDILLEMQPSAEQLKIARSTAGDRSVMAFNCSGPLLTQSVHKFAAKIGFALHYEATGRIVPRDGAVATWWITNYSLKRDGPPAILEELLNDRNTLRQGRWDVAEQFGYSSRKTRAGDLTVHFAAFRFAFGVFAYVAEREKEISIPATVKHVRLHRPGWLRVARPSGGGPG